MDELTPINVLLVDDRPENLLALEALLEDQQLNLVRAQSGEEALKRLLEQDFALILLDVQMPGMDGFETAALIRERGRNRDTPIIFLTAIHRTEEHAVRGYQAGAVDYLVKPLVPEILRSKVEIFVEMYQRAEQARRKSERLLRERQEHEARLEETAQRLERADQALEAATIQLQDVFASVEGVFISSDRAGRLLQISPSCARLFGLPPEAFLHNGLRWQSTIHPADAPLWQELADLLAAGQSASQELRVCRPGGDVRWVHVRGEPRPDRDDFVVTDVTERRQMEAALRQREEQFLQLQKLEAVGMLAGGVAHDFNNLVTTIMGYSELLLDRLPADDGLRHIASEIQQAGERAAGLTRQLLAFGRRPVARPRPTDLNTVVGGMSAMLARLIGEDIQLSLALCAEPAWVDADTSQLEQVVVNLVVNARDAMPRGGRLTVETHPMQLDDQQAGRHGRLIPGPYLQLAVSDTGTGMSPEVQSHIFDPFFTTKEPGKGTGLGLSTVYGIVKQAGGHVAVYSEPDRGSTFKIYLPRAAAGPAAAPAERPPAQAPRGTETVLVAEDDQWVRELVVQSLQAYGYKVVAASHGAEALALAEGHDGPIHLLLSDVVMPGMSGPDLARQLLARRPTARVLYMSGYADSAVIDHGVLDPALSFLQKPFTPDRLARKLREVLDA